MSGTGSPTPGSRQRERDAAEKRGRAADRAAADADKSAAEREQSIVGGMQAASDADRRSSEKDDADSDADQRASDHDQDVQDGPDKAAPRAPQPSKVVRKTTAKSRRATRDKRTETARLRETASGAESPADVVEEVQELAARGRSRAASDRRRSAGDRRAAAETQTRLEAELYAARLDSLTGAFGRDLGTTMLTNEIDRAQRGDKPFVLAFIDIDDMKGLNDRDGHAAGDEALRSLVTIMRANLRSFDPIVRYGGDEFLCGIGGVDVADVERRFKAVDAALREQIQVGISAGVAKLEPNESLDGLIARADANLLATKRGRPRAGGRQRESRRVPGTG
jgi:diguanylate cyclase (GGDEF)-like protein